jgi:hypothetical protein
MVTYEQCPLLSNRAREQDLESDPTFFLAAVVKLLSHHIPQMILYWLEHAAGSHSVCVPNQNVTNAQVMQSYNDTNYDVDLKLGAA